MSAALWVIFSAVVALGASGRGRSCFGWFMLSCLISPLLALILLALLPSKKVPLASYGASAVGRVIVCKGAEMSPETARALLTLARVAEHQVNTQRYNKFGIKIGRFHL